MTGLYKFTDAWLHFGLSGQKPVGVKSNMSETAMDPRRSAIEALYVQRLADFFVQKHDNEGCCSSTDCQQRRDQGSPILCDPNDCPLDITDWAIFLWTFLQKDMYDVLRHVSSTLSLIYSPFQFER